MKRFKLFFSYYRSYRDDSELSISAALAGAYLWSGVEAARSPDEIGV